MAISGLFYGIDSATLAEIKADYVACLKAIAVAGQTYSISGRQFTRANLKEVAQIVAEIQAAIDRANGNQVARTYPNFSN